MREDLSLFQEGCFESIFIETHSGALIGEVYRVPGTGTRSFLEKYENIIKTISNEHKSVVIGSDQNIDLLKARDHSDTSDFIDMNYSYGLAPTITRPTRITHSTSTLIDNFLLAQIT